MHDISAGGALIMASLPFKVGDIVFLKLESIDDLTSEVRHREDDRVGLRFKIEPRQQLSLVKSLSAMVQAGQDGAPSVAIKVNIPSDSPANYT